MSEQTSKEPLKQITFEEASDFITGLEETAKERIKQKRNWENAFQKWSDEQSQDGLTPLGKCGYGVICDWCDGEPKGRSCVRALNDMCRDKGLRIDYNDRDFVRVWNEGK